MNFTVGNKEYVFQPYEGSDACNRCVFHKKPHSCKASDLFDSGVLPQCDEDGIGRGYFIKSEDTEHSYLGDVVQLGDYIIISGETYSIVGLSSWGVQLLRCSYDGDTNRLTKSWQELEMSKPIVKRTVVIATTHRPGSCPKCETSEYVDYGDVEFNKVSQCYLECECQQCGTQWREIYRFESEEVI